MVCWAKTVGQLALRWVEDLFLLSILDLVSVLLLFLGVFLVQGFTIRVSRLVFFVHGGGTK